MDNYPPDAWQHLGETARERRGQLGYGFRQRGRFLRDRGGPRPPSGKMLSRLENGTFSGYPDDTIASLERLYGWERGSFEAVLRREPPVPSPGTPGAPAAPDDGVSPAAASVEEDTEVVVGMLIEMCGDRAQAAAALWALPDYNGGTALLADRLATLRAYLERKTGRTGPALERQRTNGAAG